MEKIKADGLALASNSTVRTTLQNKVIPTVNDLVVAVQGLEHLLKQQAEQIEALTPKKPPAKKKSAKKG